MKKIVLSISLILTTIGVIPALTGEDGFIISDISYDDKVNLKLITRTEFCENVQNLMANITSGSAEIISVSETIEKI